MDGRRIRRRVDTPIGALTVVGTARGVSWVGFEDGRYEAPEASDGTSPAVDAACAQLMEYFAGTRRTFDVPLDLEGTGFQQRVWRALTEVGFGETTSYGALASRLESVARAVGNANGRNPVSIIVPCHRVVGSDGTLTGYAGGLERKRWLLGHESGQGRLL